MSTPQPNWRELNDTCRTLHALIYAKRDLIQAKRLLPELERLLDELPVSDKAIVRAEALALQQELLGNLQNAIVYRRLEIELTEELHQDVRDNDYDEKTQQALLSGRDKKELEARRGIILALERRQG